MKKIIFILTQIIYIHLKNTNDEVYFLYDLKSDIYCVIVNIARNITKQENNSPPRRTIFWFTQETKLTQAAIGTISNNRPLNRATRVSRKNTKTT